MDTIRFLIAVLVGWFAVSLVAASIVGPMLRLAGERTSEGPTVS